MVDGVAKVDEDKCKACGKCVDVCPRHIIALVPYKTKRHVAITCSSKDKGPDVRKNCDNGCIGCTLCAKSCPKEAITMVDNLAVIDYDKCVGCGLCAQKCPRKLITVDGKVPEIKPAAPKASGYRMQSRSKYRAKRVRAGRHGPFCSRKRRFRSAASAVLTGAPLEGVTLGGGAALHVGVRVAHLDLIEGAVVGGAVMGAAGHGALDAVIGLVVHNTFPPLR